ncbi:MAG: chorismate synthase [Paludibacteraceae bacterium]|nr:chorismate synthase [Paludibacteraceae bacterium]
MNTFGNRWRFTSFGESHGKAIGGVLDGVPAGIEIDISLIRNELSKRAGKQMSGVSARAVMEKDEVEWLSGVIEREGRLVSLGSPIAFLIRNTDARASDYNWALTSSSSVSESPKPLCRPGHADYTYEHKYGLRDYRGGGRSSARETASRVVAGSIARQVLTEKGVSIRAWLSQVGEETDPQRFDSLLKDVQQSGDSIGGIVSCEIEGVPVGIGEPIFGKFQSFLASAMLSINGCKGFDYGTGFSQMGKRGSELYKEGEVPCPKSGGIEGGISNGLPICFRCVFKPAATLTRIYKGRHDSCIAVRAVPVVEAMAALVVADMIDLSLRD